MPLRTRPPQTPELPPFRLPAVHETPLENGLDVILVEDRRFPMVTARLGFEAGSKFDPEDLPGISESTGALVTEGTAARTARQIAEEAASIGGSLHADSSPDSLILAGSALAEHLPRLLELMADVARNATFPEDEVALRKQNRMHELIADRSEAAYLAEEKFTEIVFAPHPYARQDPTRESIARFERGAFIRFRDEFLTPDNAVLVLLGALPETAAALDLVRAAFGGWRKPAGAGRRITAHLPEPRRRIVLIDRPGSVQADIRIGRLAVTRSDPDYFPMLAGNTILGGGASSRLFTNVREKMGYAYDVRSALQPLKQSGSFAVVTQVRNEVLQPAVEALSGELNRMAEQPVAEDELSTAKNYLSGVFVIRLETQDGLASQIAAVKLMGLPLEYLERYTERVRGVAPARIAEAAQRYFRPDCASIVVVGDAASISKQVEVFGRVEVEPAE